MLEMVLTNNGAPSAADGRVMNAVAKLLKAHLERLGLSKQWACRLLERTGAGGNETVKFRHIVKDATGEYPVYMVRPFDRDTAWNVKVFPPPGVTCRNIEDIEKPMATAPAVPAPASKYTACQIHRAKVLGHLYSGTDCRAHGLRIVLGNEGVEGYIPLADISPTYNRRELDKYPVGTVISRVAVADPTRKPMRCTLHVDGLANPDDSRDVFTGRPDKAGVLNLAGFTRDIGRTYELLGELKTLAECCRPKGSGDNPAMPRIDVLACASEFFQREYGAKVSPVGIVSMLTGLCKVAEPMLRRVADDYQLTEFGWTELGARVEQRQPPPADGTDAREVSEQLKAEEAAAVEASPGKTEEQGVPMLSPDDVAWLRGKVKQRVALLGEMARIDAELARVDKELAEAFGAKPGV